jgi:hypothetical protein
MCTHITSWSSLFSRKVTPTVTPSEGYSNGARLIVSLNCYIVFQPVPNIIRDFTKGTRGQEVQKHPCSLRAPSGFTGRPRNKLPQTLDHAAHPLILYHPTKYIER